MPPQRTKKAARPKSKKESKPKKKTKAQKAETLTFPAFPDFPKDIRTIIWNLTLESRIVPIFINEEGYQSKISTPAALEVNQDSRSAVIHLYPLSFLHFDIENSPATIRFNFELDTLYLPYEMRTEVPDFFSSITSDELEKIQHLALDMRMFREYRYTTYYELKAQRASIDEILNAIYEMSSLQRLTQVYKLTDWAPHCEWLTLRYRITDGQAGKAAKRIRFVHELPENCRAKSLEIDPILPSGPGFFGEILDSKKRVVWGVQGNQRAVTWKERLDEEGRYLRKGSGFENDDRNMFKDLSHYRD